MKMISALLSGFLFAIGLGISGMTKPSKVLGFLDLQGSWDPSLLFVMVGGIAVYASFYTFVRRRLKPLLDDAFHIPAPQTINKRLIFGAAIFGIGWGAGGYCPGPALTSLANGAETTLAFVLAMVCGMVFYDAMELKFYRAHKSPPHRGP